MCYFILLLSIVFNTIFSVQSVEIAPGNHDIMIISPTQQVNISSSRTDSIKPTSAQGDEIAGVGYGASVIGYEERSQGCSRVILATNDNPLDATQWELVPLPVTGCSSDVSVKPELAYSIGGSISVPQFTVVYSVGQQRYMVHYDVPTRSFTQPKPLQQGDVITHKVKAK